MTVESGREPRGATTLRDVLERRLRERRRPRPGDQFYLHLADLRVALAETLAPARGEWLDFGSGTAPYRDLMPEARLFTADLAGGEAFEVDYELGPNGECPCADESFDGVLSTQVIEHAPDAAAHLADAFRVLRPGGRLVLSTHGIWEEHGGLDFWRWTAAGLASAASDAGFQVDRVRKLTCGDRAAIMFLRRVFATTPPPARGIVGALLWALRTLDARFAALDRYADRHLSTPPRAADDAVLYIAILLEAHRPDSP